MKQHSRSLRWSLTAAALLAGATLASAQTKAPPSVDVEVHIDSGWVQNLQEGGGPQVIASIPVYASGASWMRLYFSDVALSGRLDAGRGAFLRITSMLDGNSQLLNARHVEEWQKSSAYFNGDAVLVELLAWPGTGRNRVVLDKITTGFPALESQCGGTDDRVPSNNPAASRLLPIGCTSWIIDDACGCFLTAGHCSGGAGVVQFNVPLSNSNGSLNNPPPSDQYSVDQSSIQSNGGQGIGNDYAYFGVFPNSNTGLTPRQAQGAQFVTMLPPTFQNGQVIRITGYGVDSGVNNQIQQTHTGPRISTPQVTELEYQVDTQGGNSGSPIIFEANGTGIGIHTHGGCSSTSGNHGTGLNHPGLQAFLASPQGVCFKVSCGIVAETTLYNGSGVNQLCLQSLNTPVIGQSWEVQVDASQTPGATASFIQLRRGSTSGTIVGAGEILIDLNTPLLFASELNGSGPTVHSVPIPLNTEIAGFQVVVQGGVFTPSGLTTLCNAEIATVGCE